MKGMTHTILFNKSAICFNQCGVSFFNETTGAFALSFESSTSLPAKLITFDVSWAVNPQKGDRIKWLYDGTGSYHDADHVRMLPQDLTMINCAGIDDKYEKGAA